MNQIVDKNENTSRLTNTHTETQTIHTYIHTSTLNTDKKKIIKFNLEIYGILSPTIKTYLLQSYEIIIQVMN